MLNGRDRIIAALFAVQLLAAGVFGVVLVRGLGDKPAQVLTTAPQESSTQVAPSAAASAAAQAGTAGTAARTTTTTSGGSSGVTAESATGVSAARIADGAPIKVGSIVTQTGAINF